MTDNIKINVAPVFAGDKELCISYAEDGVASLTSSIRRYNNKAMTLAEKYPNDVKLYQNEDGSVYMQFPADWIKFPSPKKKVSAENKQKAAERLKQARENRKN